jgi:hypothetical protein
MQAVDVRTILTLNHELNGRMSRSPEYEKEKTKLAKLFAFYTKNLEVPKLNFRAKMNTNGKYIHRVVEDALREMRDESDEDEWWEQFRELREWLTKCTNGKPCMSFPLERIDIREENLMVQKHVAAHPTPLFIDGEPEMSLNTPDINYGNTGREDPSDDEEDDDENDKSKDEVEEKEQAEEPDDPAEYENDESVEEKEQIEEDPVVENDRDEEGDKGEEREITEEIEEIKVEEDENENNSLSSEPKNVENESETQLSGESKPLHGQDLRGEIFRHLDYYPQGIHYNEMSRLVNYPEPNRVRIILSGADRRDIPSITLALGNGHFVAKKYITEENVPKILEYQKKFHGNLSKLEHTLRGYLEMPGVEPQRNDPINFDQQLFIYNLSLDDEDKARIFEMGSTKGVRDGIMKQISNIKSAVKMIAKERHVSIPSDVPIEKIAINSFKIHEKDGKKVGRIGVRKVWESLVANKKISHLIESAGLEVTPDLLRIAQKVYEDVRGDRQRTIEFLQNIRQQPLNS